MKNISVKNIVLEKFTFNNECKGVNKAKIKAKLKPAYCNAEKIMSGG